MCNHPDSMRLCSNEVDKLKSRLAGSDGQQGITETICTPVLAWRKESTPPTISHEEIKKYTHCDKRTIQPWLAQDI